MRESKRLSQAELASLINVSQSTIWEWEHKDHDVKLDHILNLGEALETEIRELIKDGTPINIQHINNNKLSNNSAIGMEVTIESYYLQKELITHLKKQIAFLEGEVSRLKSSVS